MDIFHFDVVCIGSGASGMMAAISASMRGMNVCVVSKDPIGWGNTRISGGIVTTNEATDEKLYADILKTGEHINQKKLVKTLLKKSKDINLTLEKWGHIYLRNPHNPTERVMVKPGGHSIPRTLKSYHRGISIANSLRNKFLEHDIKILEEVVACKILVQEKIVRGLLCYDWSNNSWIGINADNVILACGGAGMIYYPHSDNMRSSTGDGYALGLMAGARLIDMEQIQFIPFGILYPEGMKGLEVGDTSAAGPYGVLRNKNGEVIVNDLPNRTREFVSRAIALEVQKGNGSPHGGLWLDPTENRKYEDGEKDWLHWKSIGTTNTLKMAYGTKASQWSEQFEVSPTEHYFMGGIQINENGETDITGLYAVGETAGGFHGAGRMGSMSLFEGLSLGKMVGEKIGISSAEKKMLMEDGFNREIQQIIAKYNREKNFKSIQLKKELSKIMWEKVGIIRCEEGLTQALNALLEIEEKAGSAGVSFEQRYNQQFLERIELDFMILTAKAVTISALKRCETRGSHFRSDYPEKVANWQKQNVVISI